MTLKVQHLELVREDGARLLAPLSLCLKPGERLGLAGESGSGKSLFIQAIFGVLPPGVRQSAGNVEAFGIPLDKPHPHRDRIRGRRLGWVPQDSLQALNPYLNIQDHLSLLPRVHLKEKRGQTLARLGPLLERLRLPADRAFLKRFPFQLSGGQRQRLTLAMALSCDPDLLVLDEPTTALDPTIQAEFLELMMELQRERGLGYLWITHDLGVAGAVTDRLLILYGGEAMEAGPTRRLLEAPSHPYTQRLLAAAREEPSHESGFLANPGQRDSGCPFHPRCPMGSETCRQWGPWKGTLEDGLRCERN